MAGSNADSGETYTYNGPDGRQKITADELARAICQAPDSKHHVWQRGWPEWKSWREVAAIAAAVDRRQAHAARYQPRTDASGVQTVLRRKRSKAAAPGSEPTYYYRSGKTQESLALSEIATRIQTAPRQRHLIWRKGWSRGN